MTRKKRWMVTNDLNGHSVDLVIGTPSYDEADNIGFVVETLMSSRAGLGWDVVRGDHIPVVSIGSLLVKPQQIVDSLQHGGDVVTGEGFRMPLPMVENTPDQDAIFIDGQVFQVLQKKGKPSITEQVKFHIGYVKSRDHRALLLQVRAYISHGFLPCQIPDDRHNPILQLHLSQDLKVVLRIQITSHFTAAIGLCHRGFGRAKSHARCRRVLEEARLCGLGFLRIQCGILLVR